MRVRSISEVEDVGKVFTFTEGGAEVEGGTALPPEN